MVDIKLSVMGRLTQKEHSQTSNNDVYFYSFLFLLSLTYVAMLPLLVIEP